jgi:predicted RNase H-like HicB family nuclease
MLLVRAYWDPDAKVWWTESDDIPGLVTEASTLEKLIENILALAPDLIKLNNVSDDEIPITVMAERVEHIKQVRFA